MLRYGDEWKAVMSAKGVCEKGKIHTGIDPGLAIECTRCQLDAGEGQARQEPEMQGRPGGSVVDRSTAATDGESLGALRRWRHVWAKREHEPTPQLKRRIRL
jgi:hypothetical protein